MPRARELGPSGFRTLTRSLPSIAFISTYPPIKCGLATYTTHLLEALQRHDPRQDFRVAAITPGSSPGYAARVRYDIPKEEPQAYLDLAQRLNADGTDVVALQHEYGIFGGNHGEYITSLLERLNKPVVTTLHTVLSEPNPQQKHLLQEVGRLSRQVVVMSQKGIELLREIYGFPMEKIALIPHGAPAGIPTEEAKTKLGLQGRTVISTFGLLSRGKGLEYAMEAFARIAAQHPDAVYAILGLTHPNVIATEGESYREALAERVREAHLEDRVLFVNRYLAEKELIEWLSATDIYLTPYINSQQITSGTLAYAIAQGKAVISTPYLYAQELLGAGRGLLASFRSAESIAENLGLLLDHSNVRRQIEERALRFGRTMLWPMVAAQYSRLFREVGSTVPTAVRVHHQAANLSISFKRPASLPAFDGMGELPSTPVGSVFNERSISCLPRQIGSSFNPASRT